MEDQGYRAYPRDFLESTIGMPFDLKCAYRLALDLIYMRGGALIDEPRFISGFLGCSVRAWNAHRAELIRRELLAAGDGVLAAPLVERWANFERQGATRPAIPTAVAAAVRARDGEMCIYCGDTQGPFHLDHIVPWSRGGEHSEENLAVACAPCNFSKGSKTIEEWRGRQ